MSLTHVCAWTSGIGYQRITVEEACKKYPVGVSARSSYFVCELCAQNVLLTSPGKNSRYFRHDPTSPNKECSDRQVHFDPTYGRFLRSLNSHTMPLRLTMRGSTFSLQIGFFYPADPMARCDKIKIIDDFNQTFEYSFERIEQIGTTYLNAGLVPSSSYKIQYINANSELKKFWTDRVSGINATGSFFDGRTGQILQSGGKAYAEDSYYLLQKYPLRSPHSHIEVTEVETSQINPLTKWYLYKIQVKKFSKYSAKFFLKYAVFLTETPAKFYPVWPPYFKDPYFIYHNSSNFYFYLCDNDSELQTYPATMSELNTQDGRLYKLLTRDREQLVSFGKSGALGFSYLIRQPLNKKALLPAIAITDHSGDLLTEEVYTKLPKSKFISVLCPYDGMAIVKRKGRIKYIYKLSSDQSLLIDELSFGTEIYFYQGNDCVRFLRFEEKKHFMDVSVVDEILAEKLKKCNGSTISVSHAIGAIVGQYIEYPQTKRWIYSSLRQGKISRRALQLLKDNIPERLRRGNNE